MTPYFVARSLKEMLLTDISLIYSSMFDTRKLPFEGFYEDPFVERSYAGHREKIFIISLSVANGIERHRA